MDDLNFKEEILFSFFFCFSLCFSGKGDELFESNGKEEEPLPSRDDISEIQEKQKVYFRRLMGEFYLRKRSDFIQGNKKMKIFKGNVELIEHISIIR